MAPGNPQTDAQSMKPALALDHQASADYLPKLYVRSVRNAPPYSGYASLRLAASALA